MPVYEYRCVACGVRFDKLVPMSAADARFACPDCGAEAARQVSLFAAHSRGEGGQVTSVAGGGCAGCSGGSCAGCHH